VQPITVTIDGPAGAGKSTVARLLARRLGFAYVDTGAMYRALALEVLRAGLSPQDGEAIASLLPRTRIQLGGDRVRLNGEDVTHLLRTPSVDRVVSQVSAHPAVRTWMLAQQRCLARGGAVVIEGRDAGTAIAPEAERKFFLTATLEERARRRQEQLASQGVQVSMEELVADMARRDQEDAQRSVAPLTVPPDAEVVDTTGHSLEWVVDYLAERCQSVWARP
jgi:cytidylate kinase